MLLLEMQLHLEKILKQLMQSDIIWIFFNISNDNTCRTCFLADSPFSLNIVWICVIYFSRTPKLIITKFGTIMICFVFVNKWESTTFFIFCHTVWKKNQHISQFEQIGSYTKLLLRSWKFHQLCILSSTIQWCYPKYWKLLCHFYSCLSMLIIIKIINFTE